MNMTQNQMRIRVNDENYHQDVVTEGGLDSNAIDKEVYNFEEYYCAFLDILGYKDKLELFFQNKYNLYGRIERAMSNAGVEFREDYPDRIKTHIFSDSIIITIPKTDNSNLNLLINYISTLIAQFSYERLFIRGGISLGKLFEDPNINFLASEGLVKAYQLEQKAVYPMIVIDEDLISQVIEKKLIVKNANKYIVNYVRYIINEEGDYQQYVAKELAEIVSYRDSASNDNVREKYNWLINYYLWFIELSNNKFKKFDMNNFTHFISKERDPRFVFS
jgi:hypothetical protein